MVRVTPNGVSGERMDLSLERRCRKLRLPEEEYPRGRTNGPIEQLPMSLPSQLRQISEALVTAVLGLFLAGTVAAQTETSAAGGDRIVRLPGAESDHSWDAPEFSANASSDPRLPRLAMRTSAVDSVPDEGIPLREEVVAGPCIVPDWIAVAFVERANLSCDGQQWLSEFGANRRACAARPSCNRDARPPRLPALVG